MATQKVIVQQCASFVLGHRKFAFITRRGQFHQPAANRISDECELYLINLYDHEMLNDSDGFSDFWCGHNLKVAVDQCNAYFQPKHDIEFVLPTRA